MRPVKPRPLSKEAYSSEDFSLESDVSRETFECFLQWDLLLKRWNSKINLVSKSAMADFWKRHALDSWQVTRELPVGAPNIIDLGSGAGFPGLALAIALKARGEGHVLLVESAGKKTNFLRTVIRELDLPAEATSMRAETLEARPYDVVSARAFAPLPRLLTYAQPFWAEGTIGLFLKGLAAEQELTDARKYWTFRHESHASVSDPEGVMLKISGLMPNSLKPES